MLSLRSFCVDNDFPSDIKETTDPRKKYLNERCYQARAVKMLFLYLACLFNALHVTVEKAIPNTVDDSNQMLLRINQEKY